MQGKQNQGRAILNKNKLFASSLTLSYSLQPSLDLPLHLIR
jgi:hypothetical protein